jgi:hypothetical protein
MEDGNIFENGEEYKSLWYIYIKKRVADDEDVKDILQVLVKNNIWRM